MQDGLTGHYLVVSVEPSKKRQFVYANTKILFYKTKIMLSKKEFSAYK